MVQTARFQLLSFVLALLVSFTAHSATFENLEGRKVSIDTCSTHLKAPGKTRLQDEEQIIITSWNVENVMENRGSFFLNGVNEETQTYHYERNRENDRPLEDWKFPAKQEKLARVGQDLQINGSPLSHFIVSPEVETLNAADGLYNTGVLAGKYRSILIEGNDERGIDVAFAVRADLDVTIEAETHKDTMWNDPVTHQKVRLFSRDIPVLIIKDGPTGKVLMILAGNHAKSKRDRGGDHESTQLRTAQYEAAKLIFESYKQKYPNTPIFFAGDFNTDAKKGPEVAPIRSIMIDAFDVVGAKDRVTQTYYPPEGGMIASQLDAVFMTENATRYVLKAEVLPEFDRHTGKRLGVPKSFQDRQDNYPSDHRAIAVVLDGSILK